jgi:hypothetical protein
MTNLRWYKYKPDIFKTFINHKIFQNVNPFIYTCSLNLYTLSPSLGQLHHAILKKVWLLVKPSLNFIAGNKFAFSYGLFERDRAQRLNVFPPMSLLSLLRCAHARCRAGNSRF